MGFAASSARSFSRQRGTSSTRRKVMAGSYMAARLCGKTFAYVFFSIKLVSISLPANVLVSVIDY